MTYQYGKVETIRNVLFGSLHDFLQESGFGAVMDLTVELVYELSDFREESEAYFPDVFLLKIGNGEDTLTSLAPSAQRISLESIEIAPGTGAKILKNTAALAEAGWAVYISIDGKKASYGVFRSEISPIAVSTLDMLVASTPETGIGLLIRNCSKKCVELVACGGRRMEMALTVEKPGRTSLSVAIEKLAKEITADVEEEYRGICMAYFEKLLFRILQRSHGTIILVVPSIQNSLPGWFEDGIAISPPVDFERPLREFKKAETAASLSELFSLETLLRGMIRSDGLTIFGSDATIRAYRVFVKPDADEHRRLSDTEIHGGARSRAHELLKLRLGDSLNSVFYQSHDGKSNCTVKNE
jgi:hypothetical protein